MTTTKLTKDQKAALVAIGTDSRVDYNSWTAAGSLIRKGLATKVPTVAPHADGPIDTSTAWGARNARLPRAEYRLTAEGLEVLAKIQG